MLNNRQKSHEERTDSLNWEEHNGRLADPRGWQHIHFSTAFAPITSARMTRQKGVARRI